MKLLRSRLTDIPLYLHIAYLFISLLVLFAALSNGYHYYETRQLMMERAHEGIEQLEQMVKIELSRLFRPTKNLVELLAQQPLLPSEAPVEQWSLLPFLATALKNLPFVSAIYIGFENGDSLILRPWHVNPKPASPYHFNPPSGTVWIVQSKHWGQAGQYLYFNADLSLLGRSIRADYRYDPRQRPWYQPALQTKGTVVSKPYLDFTTQKAAVSFSIRLPSGMGVLGADIDLSTLDTLLEKSRITPNTQLALLDNENQVVSWFGGNASLKRHQGGQRALLQLAELHSPVLQRLQQQIIRLPLPSTLARESAEPILTKKTATTVVHKDVVVKVGDETWQGGIVALPFGQDASLTLLVASPYNELVADAIKIRNNGVWIALLLLVLGVLLALVFARFASRPLRELMNEARNIERFEFDRPVTIKTHILEVAQLVNAMERMKTTIHRFLDLSMALSSETNFQHLLAFLLQEMKEITHAQGGILYLAEDEAKKWRPVQAIWHKHSLTESDSAKLGIIELGANMSHPVADILLQESKTVSLPASVIHEHFSALVPQDHSSGLTMLVLPLNNRNGEKLGILILLLDEQKRSLTPERLAFAEALSSTASVALYTQGLVNERKVLLDSFIQLMAGAIDAKNVYTGGHCQRVPELTRMLAEAACAEQEGPFRDFNLTPEQWEELHIAAWLHDCGKVTTPEYVVDKATKLETIYDRIHEIRMRFEVLKREAELAYWKAVAKGDNAQEAERTLQQALTQLDEEYAFVAAANEGGEYMAPEKVERLKQIGQRTWLRTLSDRIGISEAEKIRKEQEPEAKLPVLEPLLADKPEHIFLRSESEKLATDNRWGFSVRVPEFLYNRGEIYNLSVSRGTLTEEERYKINEHIIQTIVMLEKLPFPRHLRHVPQIAGGHHEKIDGKGYPRGLCGEQMSIQAKIMAIADIFEALTAIDRPYKRGKTLSETLKIMSKMQKDQHIDRDLFALFLRAGIYQEYARRYMKPEQIDAVDITTYLAEAE